MRQIGGLGYVLVNGRGRTLYVFTPEKGGKVVCTGSCASLWPPMTMVAGANLRLQGNVHSALVSSVANPAGGKIVTYAGYPLHTYTPDTVAGSVKGQGIGGQWYVISPSGTLIKKTPSSSTTSSSSSGGGY